MKIPSQKYFILFSIVLLLLGAGWIWISKTPFGSDSEQASQIPRAGFKSPDFEVMTIDGGEVKLSDYHGQPIILNLWASWCPPCRAEMPALQKVYQSYRDQGLVVLAVNLTTQDSEDAARKFISELEVNMPILLDTSGEAARIYESGALPTTYFIDRFGTINEVVVGGPLSEALLFIRAEELLDQ